MRLGAESSLPFAAGVVVLLVLALRSSAGPLPCAYRVSVTLRELAVTTFSFALPGTLGEQERLQCDFDSVSLLEAKKWHLKRNADVQVALANCSRRGRLLTVCVELSIGPAKSPPASGFNRRLLVSSSGDELGHASGAVGAAMSVVCTIFLVMLCASKEKKKNVVPPEIDQGREKVSVEVASAAQPVAKNVNSQTEEMQGEAVISQSPSADKAPRPPEPTPDPDLSVDEDKLPAAAAELPAALQPAGSVQPDEQPAHSASSDATPAVEEKGTAADEEEEQRHEVDAAASSAGDVEEPLSTVDPGYAQLENHTTPSSGHTSPDGATGYSDAHHASSHVYDVVVKSEDRDDDENDERYATVASGDERRASVAAVLRKDSKDLNACTVVTQEDGNLSRSTSPPGAKSLTRKENPYSSIRSRSSPSSQTDSSPDSDSDMNPYSRVEPRRKGSSRTNSPASDSDTNPYSRVKDRVQHMPDSAVNQSGKESKMAAPDQDERGYARVRDGKVETSLPATNEGRDLDVDELYAKPSVVKRPSKKYRSHAEEDEQPPPLEPKQEGAAVLDNVVRHYRPGREHDPIDGTSAVSSEIVYAMPSKGHVTGQDCPPELPPHPEGDDLLPPKDNPTESGYAKVSDNLREQLVQNRTARSLSAPADPSTVLNQQRPKRHHQYHEIGGSKLLDGQLSSVAGDPGYAEVTPELRARLLKKCEGRQGESPSAHRLRQTTWSGRPVPEIPPSDSSPRTSPTSVHSSGSPIETQKLRSLTVTSSGSTESDIVNGSAPSAVLRPSDSPS